MGGGSFCWTTWEQSSSDGMPAPFWLEFPPVRKGAPPTTTRTSERLLACTGGGGWGEGLQTHHTVHWRPLELSAEGCSRKEDIYGLPPFQLVPTDVTVHGHRKDRKLRCRHAGRTREISSLVSDNQPVFSSPVFSITVGKSALHLH